MILGFPDQQDGPKTDASEIQGRKKSERAWAEARAS
jgi:hypothetical protein